MLCYSDDDYISPKKTRVYEGDSLILNCDTQHLAYTWKLNGKPLPCELAKQKSSFIKIKQMRAEYKGYYVCSAPKIDLVHPFYAEAQVAVICK